MLKRFVLFLKQFVSNREREKAPPKKSQQGEDDRLSNDL